LSAALNCAATKLQVALGLLAALLPQRGSNRSQREVAMKARIIALIAFAVASGSAAPAEAQGKDPPGVDPTHYQCYRVEVATKPMTLKTLQDQFGLAEKIAVSNPMYLCVPTAKNGVEPKDAKTHYLCYQDKGVKTPNRKVRITNQFGNVDLTVGAAAMLCVPSLKEILK
jgi:hypothetical protein